MILNFWDYFDNSSQMLKIIQQISIPPKDMLLLDYLECSFTGCDY